MYFSRRRCLLVTTLVTTYLLGLLIIPLIMLELGAYSRELRLTGYDVNGTLTYVSFLGAYFVFSLGLIHIIPNKVYDVDLDNLSKKLRVAFLFLIILLMIYAIPIFVHGSILTLDLNRYEYADLKFAKKVSWLKHYICYLMFFIGVSVGVKKFNKTAWLLIIVTGLLFVFKFEKFSGLHSMAIFFFFGYVMSGKKLPLTSTVAVALLILSIYLAINNHTSGRQIHLFEVLVSRIVLQAQLLWLSLTNQIFLQDWSLFYSADPKATRIGMEFMMQHVLPTEELEKKSGGLTGGYPAILFFVSGVNFLSFSLFLTITIGLTFIVAFSLVQILSNNMGGLLFIFLLLGLLFIFRIFRTLIGSGDLFLLTHPYFLTFVASYVYIYIFKYAKKLNSSAVRR